MVVPVCVADIAMRYTARGRCIRVAISARGSQSLGWMDSSMTYNLHMRYPVLALGIVYPFLRQR